MSAKKRRQLEVRTRALALQDYEDLHGVMLAAYRDMEEDPWARRQVAVLLEKFPDGQIAVEVNEDEASDVILEPGQLSLHHGRMFHASGPNRSDDRRIGVAIRYVTPAVRQLVAERDYAMLVRGVDRERNMKPVTPPQEPFEQAALDFYESVLVDQASALSQGAKKTVALYD